MITLNIIESSRPSATWLDGLKAYASVPDASQDSLLESLLLRACLRVQEMADRSILACTFRLEEDEVENGLVRLYQTAAEVLTVTDGEGNPLTWAKGNRTLSVGAADSVAVEYTTEPREGDIAALLPVVYQYATALYDGEDQRTLTNILMQCR